MKAVRVAQFGGPEVLKVLTDVAIPKPNVREVLIRVKVAGINPVDTYIRAGVYARKPSLPYTPGRDGAGLVHAVGEGVSKFKIGDRVWFYGSLSGSYAEYATCRDSDVYPLPSETDFKQGAALGVPYLTAYRALFHTCKAKAGESVLIHGASGGVGIAAVQLSIAKGLRATGTAGSDDGIKLLNDIGVTDVYNHRSPLYTDEIMAATGDRGFDIIIEMLANINLGKDLQMLARGGRVAIVGSRGSVEMNPRDAMAREACIHGVMLANATQDEVNESVAFITRGLEMKCLRPVIGGSYTMEEASNAHDEIINAKGAKGKLVLLIE
eukprot:Seg128.16 transcript_id=Seg128.16/GoldUCD/mRNA.D3Y31 product="Quinone oxidoreductase" protein_id=Seg128.16/GoldUCD/D3Y31